MKLTRRPRRNRKSSVIRALVQESSLDVSKLVYPLFLLDGKNKKIEIKSMPGVYRYSIDIALKEIDFCISLGVKSFILFPVIEENLKDKQGTFSYHKENHYLHAIHTFKEKFPEICIITDIALDPYSLDGHDGIFEKGKILNDETLEVLGKMALAQAQAGADILGPSDMMDGRIAYIRNALDEKNFKDISIMSYTAKYASSFYGPFRDALDSSPKYGDKKTYQMSPLNSREALLEAKLDFEEGADFLMVKPALPYLDIIRLLKEKFPIPIAAYNVSGEYSMVKAASQMGFLNETQVMLEMLNCIYRAGADIIISYFAKDYAKAIN